MRGFPLRAVPELLLRVELPHATVTVERAAGRTHMYIAAGTHGVLVDDQAEADALAATLRAAAPLLADSPEAREIAANALVAAAAELRKGTR